MLRILSLGAGVQSTTLALMAAAGEIDRPDVAVFADTHWEPKAVYDHLAWLRSPGVLPFPINTVSAGDIRLGIQNRRNTSGGRFAAIPWHTVNPDGSHGMGRRQCSSEYKLTPIMHEIRRLLGKGPKDRIAKNSVEVMIGISLDEAQRMRPARQSYIINRYPLIDARITRSDCLRWIAKHNYPAPPKSSCIGCPFHDDRYWRKMHDERPVEWDEAVQLDAVLRTGNAHGIRATEFMHRQRVPLNQVNLTVPEDNQPGLFDDQFTNECENMCGPYL